MAVDGPAANNNKADLILYYANHPKVVAALKAAETADAPVAYISGDPLVVNVDSFITDAKFYGNVATQENFMLTS
jgi:hypothetical protein